MPRRYSSQFRKQFPGPDECVQGNCGTENTFEVVCLATNKTSAWNFFWYQELATELLSYCVTHALNLLHDPHVESPQDQSFLFLFSKLYPGPFAQRAVENSLWCSREVFCTTTDESIIQIDTSALLAKHLAFALNKAWFVGAW